ncbi:MAG TPA: dipeptide epimerase [Verrucomicrobiae bacterium]|jgi:L-alanine-DL-glutamate epimerase-like enolase superfamily enzyme|nr:dipeptide epimerase [Verrucomicrobiae bacterium]
MTVAFSTSALELALKHPFKIARGEERIARTVLFRLGWNGLEGLGESVPLTRYDETVESVRTYFDAHPPDFENPYRLEEILDPAIAPAARCGLDIALHDLIGKDLGKPLYELLGLDPSKTPQTSFTIGISDPELTLAKIADIGDHPVMKVKLGIGSAREEIAMVELIRSHYAGTIRLDANEGWNPEQAVEILGEIARFDIEFCEQPIPAGNPAGLRYIRERSKIPIVTDEDSRSVNDLPALHGCVDGINIKLAKCGGIREALKMIHVARALGMKVMLGCMVESQISASAAAHLSPLVDWADIDGPFLTAHDPFDGITYDAGKIVLNDGPGLGVTEKVAVT